MRIIEIAFWISCVANIVLILWVCAERAKVGAISGLYQRVLNDLKDGKLKFGDKNESCPCVHTTPCHPDCTCVDKYSSRGCLRCCSYGSKEQQNVMAEHLAEKIDGKVDK